MPVSGRNQPHATACRPGEGRDPRQRWIPAFAGMTDNLGAWWCRSDLPRRHKMSGFQSGDRLLARNGREGIEKLVQAVAPFEVVDEVPERYPSPDKNRGPA